MTEARRYSFDSELNVWITLSHDSIAYSDGEDVERRLLEILKQCRDLSSTSDELRQHITDWPSEYHFSPLRHALMRPFAISSGDRILELGCGCGAITRYLGETGAAVIAVEGSLIRAKIAAERCRDLPNVSIYCDNLADFSSDFRFDFVTLIGVLEYAPIFLPGQDSIGNCLRAARNFLSPEGKLVLAIENQLGLKYFNGCGEDHVGQRYFGVNDLYNGQGPVTFGKRELSGHLVANGLVPHEFFYPFPDYKLPELIFTDKGIHDPELRPTDMLYRSTSRDYGGMAQRNFHEYLTRDVIARNHLLAETANSFLVLAGTVAKSAIEQSEFLLASTFCLGRMAPYAAETLFVRTGTGISVRKRQIAPNATPIGVDTPFLHKPTANAKYVAGELHIRRLQLVLARGGSLAEVAEWVRPWYETLKTHSSPGFSGDLLPTDWLDAIPSNFVRTGTGQLEIIDTEWHMKDLVPLFWVFVRGMVNSLASCPLAPALKELTFRQVIDDSVGRLGIPLFSEDQYLLSAALEDKLMEAVYGPKRSAPPLAEVLAMPVLSTSRIPTMEDEKQELKSTISQLEDRAHALENIAHVLEGSIAELQGTLASTLASRSWRITAPLRNADQRLRRLLGHK